MANKPFKKLRFSLTGDTYSPVDEKAREDIGDLSQLDTQHKDNLVEAINEAARSGGGGTGVPSGGSKGQVLTKLSSVEGDAGWEYPPVMTANGNDPSNLTVTWNENYTAFDFYSRQELVQAEYVGSMVHLKLVKAYISVTLPDYTTLYHFEFGGITEISNGTATIATLEVVCDSPSAHSGVGVYTEAEIGVSEEAIQDAVDDYLAEHPAVSGTFTNAAKYALLNLLSQVWYKVDNADEYLTTLSNELFSVPIDHISAVINQGHNTIWSTDPLNSVRKYITVTVYYVDNSNAVTTVYDLDGELNSSESVLTVSVGDKTATVTANVTFMPSGYTKYDYVQKKTTSVNGVNLSSYIKLTNMGDMNLLSYDIFMSLKSTSVDNPGCLGARSTDYTADSVSVYNNSATAGWFGVLRGVRWESGILPTSEKTKISVVNPAQSPYEVLVNEQHVTYGDWTTSPVVNVPIVLFNNPPYQGTTNYNINAQTRIGEMKFYNISDVCVGHFVPCLEVSTNKIGMYDIVADEFCTAATASAVTTTNTGCLYSLGNW